MSKEVGEALKGLRQFMFEQVYQNPIAKSEEVKAVNMITNLYEYYMMSMDLEQDPEIPKQVLLYFAYQTNLDYLHNAYLFYYVTKRERTSLLHLL